MDSTDDATRQLSNWFKARALKFKLSAGDNKIYRNQRSDIHKWWVWLSQASTATINIIIITGATRLEAWLKHLKTDRVLVHETCIMWTRIWSSLYLTTNLQQTDNYNPWAPTHRGLMSQSTTNAKRKVDGHSLYHTLEMDRTDDATSTRQPLSNW